MKRLSHILTLVLSFALAIAPAAADAAQGPAGAVFTLTICSEGSQKTISIDQNGDPVETTHFCLDCSLVFATLADAPALPVAIWRLKSTHTAAYIARPVLARFSTGALARGPPVWI
jgi:hypothetical protein